MHIPKWLIATAGLLLLVLVAAISFLIGRETSQPPAAPIGASAPPQEPSAEKDAGSGELKPALEESRVATPSNTASAAATAPGNATTSNAHEPIGVAHNSPATAEARERVAAYFTQMDAIQSSRSSGDPEEFATTLVSAAVSGDFSGIDALVRAASDAEQRALGLQPPSECAEYHRLAVMLLQDSKTMITTLRDGLKRNDADALTSVGASAQSMKTRAEDLARVEKALRARFGL
jgi:hypothetical protein